MCGICGVINKSPAPVQRELLQDMARCMSHRGPDDEGYQTFGAAGLGFRRLSIIDLAGGHQPMSNENQTLWIVFNGEIYNYRTLREQLETTRRHRFRTQSDTEVILHLYELYGKECVHHLRGMFAFAIWDTRNQSLFMARDRFGKKPLVYADLPDCFLFGSELKALQKHPSIHKEIHYPAIDLYLSYQYIPSPATIFKQIKKLPPAHTLFWKGGNVDIQRYWEPRFLPKTGLSFDEATDQMMSKLKEATRLRMIADVPLGAFLSGGKDSSVIVGLMSELSPTPVKTFSIGFEEEEFSELPYAREVAERFHTDHHEFVVKPATVEILPKLAWHYGEPFADSSALPSYYVSQVTRQHVTVALNGDGGDETLAGYPRYQAMKLMKLLQRVPVSLRRGLFNLFANVPDGSPPHSQMWRIKRLLGLGLRDPRTAYLDTLCFFHEEQKRDLYTPFMNQAVQNQFAPDYINEILNRASIYSGIDPYLYTDMLSYLPECLMVKMDIASMANSLEARSPFLDHEFVELVATFPESWKLRGLFQSKYILTKKIEHWLPETVIKRKKQGFAVPMSRWFRGELKSYLREMLLSQRALSRGLFNRPALEALLRESESGKADHSYQLWALLMLEQWFQVCID